MKSLNSCDHFCDSFSVGESLTGMIKMTLQTMIKEKGGRNEVPDKFETRRKRIS